jgi:hypothetical protein
MNRIYQGRVTKVEILNGKNADNQPQELPDWQSALWQHHELFQDGVNYYLFCLAALASNPSSPMGKLRNQLGSVWEPFGRTGRRFKGLRDSVGPYLLPGRSTPSIDEAFAAALAGNNAEPKLLQSAVDALVADLGGDAAIQQGGRSYWPMFCNPSSKPTYPRSNAKLERDAARDWLPGWLHDPKTANELASTADRLKVGLFANVAVGEPDIVGDEAKKRLREAIAFLAETNPKLKTTLDQLLPKVDELPAATAFPRYVGSSVKGADKSRFNALLLFKYVEQSKLTFDLLRDAYPAPKQEAKPVKKSKPTEADPLLSLGDDPIKLARGERGYVFRAFTSLPCWGGKGPSDILWKEFDIAAFKEALKTANQFRLKTKERLDKADELAEERAYMDGEKSKFKPSEYSDQEPPAVLNGDPRFELVKQLFEVELAEEHYLAEGESVTYGLHPRTLRCYRELVERWNKIVKPGQAFNEAARERLVTSTDKFQTENKERIGSVTLFKQLLERDYWCLWQTPDEQTVAARQKAGFSSNILEDYQRYLELETDIARLKEPIRFTPADAEQSRRLFMFSDLAGKSKHKHLPNATPYGFAVDVALAASEGGVWKETRVRLHYSAPRLRRDGLRTGVAEDLERTAWLQPMVAALMIPEPAPQDFSKCAISLMPDKSWKGLRHLLNFPVTLDPAAVQKAIGSQARWANQFVAFGKGATEQKFFLRWPEEVSASQKKAGPWWESDEPFRCLSVDLGQRDAGAFALLDVRANADFGKKPSRFIGEVFGMQWRTALAAAGLLRLPGEDALVWRDGKWQEELYGEKGRLATKEEWLETNAIISALEQNAGEWIGADPKRWSFPELNSKLLIVAGRAQSWLARLHRWLWMLDDENKRERALGELLEQERQEVWRKRAETKDVLALKQSLTAEIQRLDKLLPEQLVLLVNRCLPLRNRKWAWNQHPDKAFAEKGCHLLEMVEAPSHLPLLAGQRGISFERIGQLEKLRRRFQSLNRVLQRELGAPPKSGRELRDDLVPDCCPDILAKLDRMKEQRVNQTAHLIVAQALGVQLRKHQTPERERAERDMHGEYEIMPGRKPVDFIVLEDLSKYLSSQARGRGENVRLMKWSHRQVTAKVKELCEPFGLPVLETPAAYSSKFCSRTGVAGFRGVEVTLKDRQSFPWSKRLEENSVEVVELFGWLESASAGHKTKQPRCLLAPMLLGPLFIPVTPQAPIMQADINAAINLGLRAMAAPNAHEIHVRIRSEAKDGQFRVRAQSKREKARWGNEPPPIKMLVETQRVALAREGGHPNFFVDPLKVATFDRAEVDGLGLPVASGRGLWKSVRDAEWKRCREINLERMRRWGFIIEAPRTLEVSRKEDEDDLTF